MALGHGLPLLPALAEQHCVGSSVPWREVEIRERSKHVLLMKPGGKAFP